MLPPPAADSLRRALGQVFQGSEYEWVERQHVTSWLSRLWHNLINWMNNVAAAHPVGFNVVLILLVVALVVILVHMGYVMVRIVRPSARSGPKAAPAGAAVIRDARAHLALADELASRGRYVEALGHLFLAVVLELDKRKVVRFHASKTPAEYVGEARLDAGARTTLATLVASLYRHLFGAVPCDADEYAAFGAAAQELIRTGGGHVVPA
ncbi:MAG TPA: DUF4129 domain-containing protein [Gemmatimonadales bacterium]|nr:DUF4129 domain-containing protein [Gemmatimonadales bacterium]